MAVLKGPYKEDLLRVQADGVRIRSVRPAYKYMGTHGWTSGLITPVNAAQSTLSTGFFWILNRQGSNTMLSFKKAEFQSMGVALAAVTTRIVIEKLSYTGEPTGTAGNPPAKMDSTMMTSQAAIMTASTGVSNPVSMGQAYAFKIAAVITASETVVPDDSEWEPSGSVALIRPGEGIVIRQIDAGAVADPRRAVLNLVWDEFELADTL